MNVRGDGTSFISTGFTPNFSCADVHEPHIVWIQFYNPRVRTPIYTIFWKSFIRLTPSSCTSLARSNSIVKYTRSEQMGDFQSDTSLQEKKSESRLEKKNLCEISQIGNMKLRG